MTTQTAVQSYTTKDGHIVRNPTAAPTTGQAVFASRLGVKLDGLSRAQASEAIASAVLTDLDEKIVRAQVKIATWTAKRAALLGQAQA